MKRPALEPDDLVLVTGGAGYIGAPLCEELLAAGHEVLLDIDWQGSRQVRSQCPEAFGIFVLPPSAEELERRLRSRGQDSDAVIIDRMQKARAEMSHWAEYDYLIVNQAFDRAVEEMATIISARQLHREAQQARHAALLESLGALESNPRIR